MVKHEKLCCSFYFPWAVIAVLLGLCVVGCGSPDAASLSGTVTYDGEPVANGNIRLLPESGTDGQGAGATITAGSYEIPVDAGMMAGEYKVVISATREATAAEAGKMNDGEEKDEAPEADEDGETDMAEAAPKIQLIPAKYNLETTLTAQINVGENTKDFDLEK